MSKKLYYLKHNAIVSAERRRDKLAYYMEVTYYDILDRDVEEAERMYDKWLAEQEIIDEALGKIVGTVYEPKAEGKYWAILNDCINRVSPL